MVESVMEEEDIEECIKKVNAIDNGVQMFLQNISQKFESLKNVKKKYLDKLVDYKVFLGDCEDRKEKEKRFRDVESLAKEFKTTVKSIVEFDNNTKKFIETIDKENEALTNQINAYKNTLKDIERYIKNNPIKKEKKEDKKKEEPKKEEPKKEEPKKEEPKKEETKSEEPKKEETKKEGAKKEKTKREEAKKEEKKPADK